MASFVVDNNVESLVADDPLTSGAVTLNVNTGHGARFPSTFPYRLTIWDDSTYPDPTDDPNMEMVHCTGRSTDAMTIARGEEGTSGVEHALGSRVALLFTAGLFNDATYGLATKLDTIDTNADVTGDNPPQTHAMSTHTDEGALSTLNTVDTAQIDDDAVLYAKIQNIVNDERILGRVSGADGIVEELTATQVLAMISVESGADVTDAFNVAQAWLGEADKNTPANDDTFPIADSAASNVMKKLKWSNLKATLKTYFDTLYNDYVHPNHSGDVTSVADGAQTIVADAVTYAKMQNISGGDRILGRSTAGGGIVEEVTCTTAARAFLDDTNVATQRATLNVDVAGTDNSTDETASSIATIIVGTDAKATPVDADTIPLIDSDDSSSLKEVLWSQIKATLKTYFDSVAQTLTNKTIDADSNTLSNIDNGEIKAAAAIVESKLTFAATGGHVHDGTAAVAGGSKIDVADLDNVDLQSFTNLLENYEFKSWSAGTSSDPDGWESQSVSISREATIIKHSTYSCKQVSDGGAYPQIDQFIPNYIDYVGKTVTVGIWVRADSGNSDGLSKIFLKDGVSTVSIGVPADDVWYWKEISIDIDASPTRLQFSVTPSLSSTPSTGEILYCSKAMLVEGEVCPAPSPKQLSANDLTIHMQTPQTLTGAGAVDILTDITHIVTTDADALTLADGAEGQEKFIVMKTDGGVGTLTPSNLGNGTTITFDDVGDSAHLMFTNGSWHWIGGTATLA